MQFITKARADRLRALPSLHQGHCDDLIKETPTLRIWRSRVELDESNFPLIAYEKPQFTAQGQRWEVVAKS